MMDIESHFRQALEGLRVILRLLSRFWRWLLRPYYAWRYRRALAKLNAAMTYQSMQIGSALLPAMRELVTSTEDAAKAMAKLRQTMRESPKSTWPQPRRRKGSKR